MIHNRILSSPFCNQGTHKHIDDIVEEHTTCMRYTSYVSILHMSRWQGEYVMIHIKYFLHLSRVVNTKESQPLKNRDLSRLFANFSRQIGQANATVLIVFQLVMIDLDNILVMIDLDNESSVT